MSLVNCIKSKFTQWKKVRKMAKNSRKKGHSARNGNAPSPYTKYGKIPYRYSFNTGKIVHIDFNEKEKEDYKRKKSRKAA